LSNTALPTIRPPFLNSRRYAIADAPYLTAHIEASLGHNGCPSSGATTMKKPLLIGVGALLVLTGVIWTLQGLGYVGGSAMTGVTLWAVVGPVVALVGVVMVAVGLRGGRAAR
jgi:hypothetical protein